MKKNVPNQQPPTLKKIISYLPTNVHPSSGNQKSSITSQASPSRRRFWQRFQQMKPFLPVNVASGLKCQLLWGDFNGQKPKRRKQDVFGKFLFFEYHAPKRCKKSIYNKKKVVAKKKTDSVLPKAQSTACLTASFLQIREINNVFFQLYKGCMISNLMSTFRWMLQTVSKFYLKNYIICLDFVNINKQNILHGFLLPYEG